MKKILFLAPLALLAMASCDNENSNAPVSSKTEMGIVPLTDKSVKGYSESTDFYETAVAMLHDTKKAYSFDGSKGISPRIMNISAYLDPQEGVAENYFVGKTFKKNSEKDMIWRNFEGETLTPIYWPIAGKLDFLAYSLTQDATKSVTVEWNKDNAASQVVLNVPGENTQNDILFSSLAAAKQTKTSGTVNMTFDHAQAWLEFVITGVAYDWDYTAKKVAKDAIKLVKIELEDVYNAGKLTIDNNGGDAVASWDFSGIMKRNIEVDNMYDVVALSDKEQYLDMLIPQQQKKDFVLYYTLGDDTKVLKYRFDMDEDSWLMGNKYIYTINITTNEITVNPTVEKFIEHKVTYTLPEED